MGKLHTCNYCDFAFIQAGNLRRQVKTNVWENHTHATNVTLNLFNQAIWEDIWKSFNGEISHICHYCDFVSVEAGHLRSTRKLTFEKIRQMQLLGLCICSNRRFEKTCEHYNLRNSHTCGRYPIWFNSMFEFYQKWFIQYSIQYCFTQDSIQNIIQFKKNSADSIQNVIQFNSLGIIDTGGIGKVPKRCPE